MAIVVTQRPEVTSPAASKWNAVGNPIVYKFTRKDFIFNQVNNNAGNIQLQFNSIDVSASFVNGNTVWVESDNGLYSVSGSVTASTFSSPNTLVTVNIPYVNVAPGGYVNNNSTRLQYKLSVDIYSGANILGTNIYSPDKKGQIIADVSRPLWANMSPDINMDFRSINDVFDDTNTYKSFYIKYTEQWIGSAQSETDDVANIFYSVYGSRQIPSVWGGNMLEYVISTQAGIVNDTDFTVGWSNQGSGQDWAFASTFMRALTVSQSSKRARRALISGMGVTINITLTLQIAVADTPETELKVYLSNGQVLDFGLITNTVVEIKTKSITVLSPITYFEIESSTATNGYNVDLYITQVFVSVPNVNRFLTKFNSLRLWRGWPCLVSAIVNIPTFTSYLSEGSFISSDSVKDNNLVTYDINKFVTDQSVDSFSVALFYNNPGGIPVTEDLFVDVYDGCENSIMLVGRNTLDGAMHWLFQFSQDYTFEYADGRKAKRLLLYADNLTINEWESLQDFITLGEVYRDNIVELSSSIIKTKSRIGSQVYAVDQEGNKVGVTVIPTNNTTKTRQEKHRFEIEIEYPEEFTT